MSLGPVASAKVDEIVACCERNAQASIIVLSGVPGTGKTFLSLAAAQRVSGHPLLVKQVQFHQSYAYEDFIEGLHPTPTGGFAPRLGVFLEWNEAALRDPDNKYVLVVEEFSRANVSAVLGELMTFIEYRDRLFETPITRRRVRVARNLVILTTMNPQDRSALELDDALIRRLRIISCSPANDQLIEMLTGSLPESDITSLCRLFDECRVRHPDTFDEMMPFGHGMFGGVASEADLQALWRERISHLLRRPNVPPHPFAKDIEELYPWRTAG